MTNKHNKLRPFRGCRKKPVLSVKICVPILNADLLWPYSLRPMMGILLYGIMKGHSSLKELERLVRLDFEGILAGYPYKQQVIKNAHGFSFTMDLSNHFI
ncbi:hypothetical protein [Xenorhabdus khoisanae]|uniref:hypothetical protein n=1 Tax=Xenorhabdus khoisanae TaxID=880157 RepID=UPI001F405FFA|nr:hypothetical protein [Xenorhabdus khoisanae]